MKKLSVFVISLFIFQSFYGQDYYRNFVIKPTNKKEKVALIIANNHYTAGGKLEQPIPTAKKLEKTLIEKGFDVLVGYDLNRSQTVSVLNEFSKNYTNYKFALVAYLGHGFEIDGKNYLIPIDANPPSKDEVSIEALNMEYVMGKINNPSIPKVVILDACRDNPFATNWSSGERATVNQGFADINAPRNAEIFFTTQKNSRVRDDNPYMNYFMDEIKNGGCIEDIVRSVSKRIYNYNKNQIPAKYGQLFDKVCFGKKGEKKEIVVQPNFNKETVVIDDDTEVTDEVLRSWTQLGRDYYNGENGKSKNVMKAISYLKNASDRGFTEAQIQLGYVYSLMRDEENTYKMFKLAAKSNSAKALFTLGTFYHGHTNYETTDENSITCLTKAVELGNTDAMATLAAIYNVGNRFTKPNYSKAKELYIKAADLGNERAIGTVSLYYGMGMKTLGFEKNSRKAMKYIKEGAKRNYIGSMYELANAYRSGKGVGKNVKKAKELLKKVCQSKGKNTSSYIASSACIDLEQLKN